MIIWGVVVASNGPLMCIASCIRYFRYPGPWGFRDFRSSKCAVVVSRDRVRVLYVKSDPRFLEDRAVSNTRFTNMRFLICAYFCPHLWLHLFMLCPGKTFLLLKTEGKMARRGKRGKCSPLTVELQYSHLALMCGYRGQGRDRLVQLLDNCWTPCCKIMVEYP